MPPTLPRVRRPARFLSGLVCAIVLLLGLRQFWRRNAPQHYIFSFGDSLTETHFDVENDHPTVANPMGNGFPGQDVPALTSAGGPNWLGQLIHHHLHSNTLSFNFARGGSLIDCNLFPDPQNATPDLAAQVHVFIDHLVRHRDFAAWTSSNAVFTVWCGNNDVAGSVETSDSGEFARQLMEAYFKQLDLLHGAGARKFVLLSVFPLHTTAHFSHAFTAPPDDADALVRHIAGFNAALRNHATQWTAGHPGSTLRIVDMAEVFAAVLDPKAGAPLDAKCMESDRQKDDDPTPCLWQDSFHPGTQLHAEVARRMAGIMREMGIGGRGFFGL